MQINKFKRSDWLFSLIISVFVFLYIFRTSDLIGYVRDEGFYMKAAEITSNWFSYMEQSFSRGDLLAPFKPDAIHKYFSYNHEHPTLMKNLFGFSHYIFFKKLKILSFGDSIRIVAALFAAFIAFFTYLMGAQFFNRTTAVVSPFLLFTMPHIFFHSHLACFDVPVLFFWFGTFILFNISLIKNSWVWAFATAVFYGLGMATKHNVFFLPILLFLVWMLHYIVSYRNLAKDLQGVKGVFKAVPKSFYLFVSVSLTVYFLNWPWLWYKTVSRFVWYYNFHAKHVNYTNYYFGEELARGPFPFSFPWA